MSHTKSDLLEAKTQLIAYVVSKIKSGDWHAVQDGASDIREIDAKLQVLSEVTPQGLPVPSGYMPPATAEQMPNQYQQYQGSQPPSTTQSPWTKRIG
jgi:hypothetical protein